MNLYDSEAPPGPNQTRLAQSRGRDPKQMTHSSPPLQGSWMPFVSRIRRVLRSPYGPTEVRSEIIMEGACLDRWRSFPDGLIQCYPWNANKGPRERSTGHVLSS